MIYGLLGFIILILIVLLFRKRQTDFTKEIQERNKIQNEVDKLKLEKEQLEDVLDQRDEAISKADQDYRDTIERNTKDSVERRNELTRLEMEREAEIERNYQTLIAAKKELYLRECKDLENEMYEEWSEMIDRYSKTCQNLEQNEIEISFAVRNKQIDYENLIAPFKLIQQ